MYVGKQPWLYFTFIYIYAIIYQVRIKEEKACNSLSSTLASRIQTWAEKCVDLHEMQKCLFFMHIHLPTIELCSFAVA